MMNSVDLDLDDEGKRSLEPSRVSRAKGFQFSKNWKTWVLGLLIMVVLLGYVSYLTYFYSGTSQHDSVGKSVVNELNFQIELLDGSIVSIAQFVGKPLIIDFFATWCAPCKEQVSILKSFLQTGADVTIVSVSVDPLDDRSKLIQYRDENDIAWTIGRDVNLKGSTEFDVFGLPTIVFVDQNGIVRNVESRVVPEDQLNAWYRNNQASVVKVFGLQVDISSEFILFPLFFIIGLYVALSPCLFPIMPLTIFNLMSKQSDKQFNSKDHSTSDASSESSLGTVISRRKVLGWTLLLCSGILLAFALFALVGLFVGTTLVQFRHELGFVLGLILLILGTFMLVPKLEERTFARIPIPQRISGFLEKDEYSSLDLFFLGFLYSMIALPCAGPAILSTIPLVAIHANPFLTLGVLILFGIGLFIPYLVLVFVTAEGQARAIKFFQSKTRLIQLIGGILIIVMGILFILPLLGGPDFIYRFGT